MARITGSSDREKRKSRSSNRPITQGEYPQRQNRQSVSKATVSTADTRNPNSVRAGLNQTNKPNGGRVTGTQGRPKPATPAKVTGGTPTPPSKPLTRQSRVNGRLVAGADTRPSPNTRAAAKPAGPTPYQVSDPWAKPKRASIGNVKGPASSPNRPAATLKPSAKPAGNFRAPALPKGAATTAANVVKGASKLKGVGRLLGPAALLGDLAATGNSVFNPNSQGNQQLARAMSAVNQRYAGKSGPRFKNSNGGSVASKGTKPTSPMPKGSGDALREKSYASLQKFDVPKPKAKPASLKAAASAPAYRGSSQGSTGSSMSRSTPKPPAKAQPGQSKDMNENYRTWAKANPALASKVKSNQSGYNAFGKDAVAGVGPVKDSSSYKPQAEKTSEMNASAVRRAALTASAGSATDSGSSETPKEKPKGTGSNFRTDIALLDKKKKK